MGQQNYKIFINGHTVIFCTPDQADTYTKADRFRERELDETVHRLSSGTFKGKKKLIFPCPHPAHLFTRFRKHFKVIRAAGGIVFNEAGQLLLIKRLGKWDLPKGKLERGEDQRLAALREVHEECGLNFLGILRKFGNTYHVYNLKGRWILKKCAWYRMIAWGDASVQPQVEEDITEVRWVDKEFILSDTFDTYESLEELFATIEFPVQRPE